ATLRPCKKMTRTPSREQLSDKGNNFRSECVWVTRFVIHTPLRHKPSSGRPYSGLVITHIIRDIFTSYGDKPSCIEEATYDLCFGATSTSSLKSPKIGCSIVLKYAS